MGLDFSHGDIHFSYGGFDAFRRRIADTIGITLDHMYGYGGGMDWSLIDDDIVPLLNHSDCDGELTPQECARVAPRLREIVRTWVQGAANATNATNGGGVWQIAHTVQQATALADAMDECARLGESLEFI